MKILLAAASFSPKISGVQRHAFNVAGCLLKRPEISAVHIVVAPWQRNLVAASGLGVDARLTTHIVMMDRNSISRNLWYYRQLPKLAVKLGVDLVHLSYPVPLNPAAFPCPTVLTLHDLYPYEIPGNFRFPRVVFNRMILRRCLQGVDVIACVSDTTTLLLKKHVPPAVSQKSVRIYNCVEAEPMRAAGSPIPGLKDVPFLLCVAQHRRNKNIPLLIRAFKNLLLRKEVEASMKLVVIGITGPETSRIHREVLHCGLSERVIFVEGLSEEDLQWCYRQCEALLAPSTTEGFGLPVAEGLLAGCRVLCSDIPAFREIDKDHVRFVPLGDHAEDAFASAIVACLQDQSPGPVLLPHLSSSHIAGQYIDLYKRTVSSSRATRNRDYVTSIEAPSSPGGSFDEAN